jgi:signal transduction histidine kinase
MRNETLDPSASAQPDRRRFSRDDFSNAQVEEMATAVAAEHRAKRLLIKVTMGHRSLALRQLTVSSIVGAMTMLSLYLLEQMYPTMDRQTLNTWAIATFANIILRVYLNRETFPSSPSEIAKSKLRRTLPLFVAVLTTSQWVWCFNLFIGAELNLQVFTLFAGLLAITVAVVALWSTVPAPAILFLGTVWPPFFFRLHQVGWIPTHVLIFVGVSAAMVLWVSVYLPVKQFRPILDGSDEVDLLVAKLHDANLDLTAANRTLDEMRKDAASRLESRSMFFASASHDFRQRLHAVKLLSRSAVHDAAVAQQEQAPLIRLADAVEDVDRYTTQMLDFARLDATALTPSRRSVSLQHMFQQLELNFEEVALAANVTLKIRVTDAVLFTDISMLERILENLLSNAIKFAHGRRVLVGARRRAGGLTIEVWDQGPGIAAENLPSIFRPFYQSSPGRNGLGGVGLGLAVVERFAEALGYHITVQSRVGHGTLMRICVPASDIQDADASCHQDEENTVGIEQRSESAA